MEKSNEGITRRDLLKYGAATMVVAGGVLAGTSMAYAADSTSGSAATSASGSEATGASATSSSAAVSASAASTVSGSTATSASATSGSASAEPPAAVAGAATGDFTREATPLAKQVQVVRDTLPSFMQMGDPITDFADTKDYDVVVVGCGASGLAAALSACEAGAHVACLQKEEAPSSQGYAGTGLELDATDPAGAAAVVSAFIAGHEYRPNRSLVEAWAKNSGEAINWYREQYKAAGVDDSGSSEWDGTFYGYSAKFVTAHPDGTFAGTVGPLADYAATKGVEFFFSTPGVQLQKDGDAVTGVIGQNTDGTYTLFTAAKGVILATGDYQSDEDMIAYYCPDSLGFPNLQMNRTGDGHRMGIWAGGRLEPIGHTKMIHDGWCVSSPYLLIDNLGERFMNENVDWELVSCLLRDKIQHALNPEDALIYSIIDADFMAQSDEWAAIDPKYAASEVPDYYGHTADTLEELADTIGVPADALVATVKRYNQLCDEGADEDFGKDARFMKPIVTPPFTAVGRDYWWGLSAIIGGFVIDADNEVLDDDDNPIKGLYAVGNVSGPFYGSADYHFVVSGISLGRSVTGGYVAGKYVASL